MAKTKTMTLSIFEYPKKERKEILLNREDWRVIRTDLPFALKSGKISYLQEIVNFIFKNNMEIFKKHHKEIISLTESYFKKGGWTDKNHQKIVLKIIDKIDENGNGRNVQSMRLTDFLGVVLLSGNHKELLKDPLKNPDRLIYYYFSKNNGPYFKQIYDENKKDDILKSIRALQDPNENTLSLIPAFYPTSLLFNLDMTHIYPEYCLGFLKKKCDTILIKCGAKKSLKFSMSQEINKRLFGIVGEDNITPLQAVMALNNTAERLPGGIDDEYWQVVFKAYKKIVEKDNSLGSKAPIIKSKLQKIEITKEINAGSPHQGPRVKNKNKM